VVGHFMAGLNRRASGNVVKTCGASTPAHVAGILWTRGVRNFVSCFENFVFLEFRIRVSKIWKKNSKFFEIFLYVYYIYH
jgi:hypothetical protein